MAKVKVQVEGKELEVELPAGYLSPDDVKETMVAKAAVEDIVTDRLARAAKSQRAKLLQDEEFRTEALTAWNIKASGKGQADEDVKQQIEAALKEAERTRFAPLQTENTTLKEQLSGLRKSQLHSAILAEATAAGVARHYLKPLPGTKTPAIIGIVEGHFGYDDKVQDWLVRNPDGQTFAVSGEAGAPHPYKGVKHFFADFTRDPEFRDFLEPSQKGADVRKPGSDGGKTVSRDDPRAFGEAAEKILKGEVTLQ